MSATPSAITSSTDNRRFPPVRVWLGSASAKKAYRKYAPRSDRVQSFVLRSVVFMGHLAVRFAVGTANTTVARRLYERRRACIVRIVASRQVVLTSRTPEARTSVDVSSAVAASVADAMFGKTTRRNNKVTTDFSHVADSRHYTCVRSAVAIPVIKSRSRRDNQV